MNLQKIDNNYTQPFIKDLLGNNTSINNLYNGTNVDLDNCINRMQAIDSYLEKHSMLASRSNIALSLLQYHENLANLNNTNGVELPVAENIQRYSEGCYTIVTGQQAGLFTGPVYTINKIISLLKTVKDLREKLGVDIIPIFWIAGEDHDVDEVDHMKINTSKQLNKVSIPWKIKPQYSVANIRLTNDQIDTVISDLSKTMPDSEFKREIMHRLYRVYANATMSVAFAALLYDIFSPYGLVLFDSHDEEIRKQQIPIFSKFIKEADTVTEAFKSGYNKMLRVGYQPLVEFNSQKTGVYINKYGKRRAVINTNEGFQIDKVIGPLSQIEILNVLHEQPQLFSTNVLLRTIMQEFLFQPLVYIGGASEVMYWGQLRPIFELFHYRMPIVILRNSYTYVTQKAHDKAMKYDINIVNMIDKKPRNIKDLFTDLCDSEFDINHHFYLLENEIEHAISNKMHSVPGDYVHFNVTKHVNQKYWLTIKKQLEQMKGEIQENYNNKTKAIQNDLRWLEREIQPNGKLQERVLNIYQFINVSGTGFISELVNDLNHSTCGGHFIVNM